MLSKYEVFLPISSVPGEFIGCMAVVRNTRDAAKYIARSSEKKKKRKSSSMNFQENLFGIAVLGHTDATENT